MLAELDAAGRSGEGSAHDHYVAVHRLITDRDRELARTFDVLSRSSALWQLADLHTMGLLARDEIARFSPDTRARLERLSSG